MKQNGNKRTINISLKLSLSLGLSTGKKRQEREVDLELPREPRELPPEQDSEEPPQAAQAWTQEQDTEQPPRAALVAYFSRMQEGPENTEDERVPDPVTALAQWIAVLTGGEIHAICAEEVSLDKEEGRTVLAEPAVPMEQYDVVFLGYPEWWDSCPAEVRSFLQTHDVSDKTIAPFCVTSGAFAGGADALREIRPDAQVGEALCLSADAVSGRTEQAQDALRTWLKQLGYHAG